MAKPKVTFQAEPHRRGEWQIIAEYPGAEDRYIKGFTDKASCHDWLNGTRKIDWLRSQGYAEFDSVQRHSSGRRFWSAGLVLRHTMTAATHRQRAPKQSKGDLDKDRSAIVRSGRPATGRTDSTPSGSPGSSKSSDPAERKEMTQAAFQKLSRV